jgi:hypothetical protein
MTSETSHQMINGGTIGKEIPIKCPVREMDEYLSGRENKANRMKALLIKVPYDLCILMPIEQIDMLYCMETISDKDFRKPTRNFSKVELDISVIDYDSVKPALPDPEENKKKLAEKRAALEKELEAISAAEKAL